jgi:serpin B
MKNDLILVGCLVMAAACAGNDPAAEPVEPAKTISLTPKQAERASIDNRFAFEMFRRVSRDGEANTFFSPLSLNMALGMLYNGAAGDTRDEMATALGMSGFTTVEFNEYYREMSGALSRVDPLTDIGIANSIWYRSGFAVKQPFLDVNRDYFDATTRALDFSAPASVEAINNWCAEKTKNRITEIVESPIPANTMMFLINALYFKSKWYFAFDKGQSREGDFTTTGGTTRRVTLMARTADLPYHADERLQCVEIPYGNQAFSMVAILPVGDMDLDGLVDYLDNAAWNDIAGKLATREVRLELPRFKVECSMDLSRPVKDAGMELIFSEQRADFSNISDEQLFVSLIKQKTFVEVNEEGTEAAAVTIIGMEATSIGPDDPPLPVSFLANRPFLYLIREKSTGVILFIGRMDEPREG